MKKAIVVGGNQTGMNVARLLADVGFDVTVYEGKKREDLAYDWTDDIDPKVFEELGLPMPSPDCYYKKKIWPFVNPNESVKLTVPGGAQENDISIYRRPLNDYFYAMTKDKAELVYETKVESLLIEGDAVTGVKVNGEEKKADLVVDCSGALSALRKSLPKEWKIQNEPAPGDTFVAYRGFFKRNEGAEEPTQTNKAYLQHNGEKGISWCITTDKEVDILIGRIDKLSKEEIDRALIALKNDNPILSDELIKCGFCSVIPVRYPLSRMVANGYVCVGDSAFMTIPLMGSGIVSGLLAGKFLAETLRENDDCSVKNLWNYQVKFYKRHASFAGVDVLKRWLLSVDAENIDFLFESGVIDEEILAGGVGGDSVKMSLPTLLKKAWQGKRKLGLLLKISGMMGTSDKATKIASEIPETFDENAVTAWQEKLDGIYRK